MEITREQKLALKAKMEIKYADILANPNHPQFDDIRFAMLAPEFDHAEFDWHPVVTVDEHKPQNVIDNDPWFVGGKCTICGESANTCECH